MIHGAKRDPMTMARMMYHCIATTTWSHSLWLSCGDDDRRSKIWSRYFIQIEILYGVHRNSNDYGESTSGQSTNFRFIRLTELILD